MIVDNIGVISCTANERINTTATGQEVVSGSANKRVASYVTPKPVVTRVAGQRYSRRGFDHSKLNVVGERIAADGDISRVDTFARMLNDVVTQIIDEINVAAGSSNHRICAGTAKNDIVAFLADQSVVARAAPEN